MPGIGRLILFLLLPAVSMSYGWEFRGDYGHESGAAVAGALFAMAVCLGSCREEWYRRTAIAGLLGAFGWGFGGAVSYGMITSYTVVDSFPDVLYGYVCLFVIGAIWGGLGCGTTIFAWTESRERLQALVWPLIAVNLVWLAIWGHYRFDSRLYEWVESIRWLHDMRMLKVTGAFAVLIPVWLLDKRSRFWTGLMMLLLVGWVVGHAVVAKLIGFHMQPKPGGEFRSNAWAGLAGMLVALTGFHLWNRNRAALMLTGYGFVGGGIGFSFGNLINIPDKVKYEPFYAIEWLRGFDHWKWTEQSFGFIMGLVAAIGCYRLCRQGLLIPEKDRENTEAPRSRKPWISVNELAAFSLVLYLPWSNLWQNVKKWRENGKINEDLLFGMPAGFWVLTLGVLMALIVILALVRHRQGRMVMLPQNAWGKGAIIYLMLMWVSVIGVLLHSFPLLSHGHFFVHWSFWCSCLICTLILFYICGERVVESPGILLASDQRWNSGFVFWSIFVTTPLMVVWMVWATMSMQEGPIEGARYRFGEKAFHLEPKK